MEEEKKENLENTSESAPADEDKVQEDENNNAQQGQEEKQEEPAAVQPVSEPAEPEAESSSEQEPEQVVEDTEALPTKPEARWYVIQTFTGQEERVKHAIEHTIEIKHLKEKVFQVLVPTEEIVEIKGGKRVEKVKMMFPGYVFLEMILDEESWYLIRQTPGVARFIGNKVKPTPVSGKEMQRVLKQLGKEERLEITFEKGEGVRVISGPFRGYTGTVDEVNPEKGKLKVLINIFGRDTPVEVNFEHAQKIV
ncbi:MAG: transcription termination/antitermination protein NusG [Candidatus Margulisbacteria bacterium]|nr:transcription termination/antitermination protein NusG [Candidatus Margulisiibacteriota bacterium]